MSAGRGVDSAFHVLTITPFFPSDQNEVSGCFVAEPIEQLKQFGVDSSVIGVSPIYRPRRRPTASLAADWARYPQIPGNFGLATAGGLLYARLLRKVQKLHHSHPIDVIHAHAALPCGRAAALLSRRLQIPFVVTLHGLDVFNTCFHPGVAAAWRRKVSGNVYRAAANVICVSGKVQQILKSGAPVEVRSTVVYNGVNPALFAPNPAVAADLGGIQPPEILSVGMLHRGKGHELILRALARLRPTLPDLRCRIIGEGPDGALLQGLAEELGVRSQVEFVGRQTRPEVAAAMRRCSVFVLPSRNEGLGCVYLEAMSCGKPVIGCRSQGIEELIDHGGNGWLISVDDLEELVAGLSVLLASAELRARIGEAARQTILEKLTLAHQAELLERIYRQAAA
jgi:teichuronic acid biosynthesis glycosyltransferase TuaC